MIEQGPQFLDVKSYRRKRWVDAARLLPLFGAIGILTPLPFLFQGRDPSEPTNPLTLYLFGLWLGLIIAAFVLSHQLDRQDGEANG